MRVGVAVVLACALAGCDPGSTLPEPTRNELFGTYTLRTVDGAPVPAVVFEEGPRRVELSNGRVTFVVDRTADYEYNYRVTDANGSRAVRLNDTGSYTVAGSKITVSWKKELVEEFQRNDSTVTMFDGALNLSFHK